MLERPAGETCCKQVLEKMFGKRCKIFMDRRPQGPGQDLFQLDDVRVPQTPHDGHLRPELLAVIPRLA